MKELKLKPCPFCGGKAEIVSMSEKFTVSCASGGCMANIAWCPDEEKAARAWNTRTFGWIPCRERMPDCGGVYIAGSEFVTGVVEYSKRAAAEGQFPFGHVNYYTDEDGGRKAEWVECKWVTHWAPFPDFPKEEQDDRRTT